MKFAEKTRYFFFLHFEWIVLSAALLLMIFINPYSAGYSFCLAELAGIGFCPGEGFGRSVALLFRGDVAASFAFHPAGIPAVFILISRIIRIFNRNKKITEEKLYEPRV